MHPVAHLRPVLQLNTYTAYDEAMPVQTVTTPPHAYIQSKAAQFQSINDWRQISTASTKRIPGYQTSYLASESLFANCNASSSYMGWKSCMELRTSQTKPKLKIKNAQKVPPASLSCGGSSHHLASHDIYDGSGSICGWRQWWICDSPTYLSLMARECSQRHRAMNSGRTCLLSPEMLLPVKLALARWLGM